MRQDRQSECGRAAPVSAAYGGDMERSHDSIDLIHLNLGIRVRIIATFFALLNGFLQYSGF